MFYTVYKIINTINQKTYIGKHQTKDLNDGYMGSGKLLKRAIKKHGVENFTKEILHVFQTEAEMNVKEKELVVLSESSYNLCEGGKGGFGYVNDNGLAYRNYNLGQHSKTGNNKMKYMLEHNDVFRKLFSESISKSKLGDKNPRGFMNKTHSEEWKKSHSEVMKKKVPWNKGKSWKDWHPHARQTKI